jgi:serine/threonine protein kinase
MIEAGAFLQGRYRVERHIGEGGMGAVFVATDERFGSTVAIKETFFSDERLTKAFEREARLLNSLRHPALPRVSDHFIEGKGQFIVMEFIHGEDLSEMMQKRGAAFPVRDVLDWADQLLDALDYLHTQEMPVIHRDIKPQNLKLTPRGQIILLDFGLAKGNPTASDSPTAAKSVFGYSRNYASLEQIQGTGTDPRSDLYSLAATLYHLVTGKPPADALTRAMSVLNGEKDPLVPAHKLHAQITPAVSEVLNRAMALNANHRPSSAAAMRELLREAATKSATDDYETLADEFGAASLFTQNTEVMADAPSRAGNLTTEPQAALTVEEETAIAKRNIKIPVAAESKATTVQPLAAMTDPGNKRRGFAVGAIALAGLLAVGATASGLYIYRPELFGASHRTAPKGEKKLDFVEPARENKTEAANVAPAVNVNAAPETATTENPALKRENVRKSEGKAVAENAPKTETKTGKQPTKSSAETKAEDEAAAALAEEGVVMKDGKIETKDLIIEGDRFVFKNSKDRPIITPEQYRQMTPEQRKKLQRLFRIQRAMPPANIAPPPAPKPMPQTRRTPY